MATFIEFCLMLLLGFQGLGRKVAGFRVYRVSAHSRLRVITLIGFSVQGFEIVGFIIGFRVQGSSICRFLGLPASDGAQGRERHPAWGP